MLCPGRLDVSDSYRLVARVTDVHVAACMLPSVTASEPSKGKEMLIWLDLFPGKQYLASTVLLQVHIHSLYDDSEHDSEH
jgi:hypothetical protein